MRLPRNVKVKSFPWSVLPLFSTYTAHALYPNVYIPKHIYEDLQSKNPNPKNVSVLIHEQTHINRQKQMGWLLWGLKYCASRKFRFEEELAAVKESMKYLKKKKVKLDINRKAKLLSSFLYLWCISYDEAKSKLDDAWLEA